VEAGQLTGVYTPREFLRSQQPVATAYAAQLRAYEQIEGGT
jgi:hypothetical protein